MTGLFSQQPLCHSERSKESHSLKTDCITVPSSLRFPPLCEGNRTLHGSPYCVGGTSRRGSSGLASASLSASARIGSATYTNRGFSAVNGRYRRTYCFSALTPLPPLPRRGRGGTTRAVHALGSSLPRCGRGAADKGTTLSLNLSVVVLFSKYQLGFQVAQIVGGTPTLCEVGA